MLFHRAGGLDVIEGCLSEDEVLGLGCLVHLVDDYLKEVCAEFGVVVRPGDSHAVFADGLLGDHGRGGPCYGVSAEDSAEGER